LAERRKGFGRKIFRSNVKSAAVYDTGRRFGLRQELVSDEAEMNKHLRSFFNVRQSRSFRDVLR
jgi:hypothetical protein